ncbi:hypothetical protein CCMSSC00406_0007810 [Pleurotus cornucopiae]|uniref:Uncharacterized protein n=1 Tax=Pleurotus cornucopiae TaxID=5321 RepID=A0ACB7J6L6_PLECO|nr:hypothetical protein CCMSSC00406_0007810 [Pleurotus cornucopiae]
MKFPALPAVLAFCVVALVTNAYVLPQNKTSVARSEPGSLLGKRYVARLGRDIPKLAKTSNSDTPMFREDSRNAATILDSGGTSKLQKASKKNAGRPIGQNRKTRFNRSLKRRKVKAGKRRRVTREGPEEERNPPSKQGASPLLEAASPSSPPDASATSAVVQASSTQSPDVPAPTTSAPPPVSTANQKAVRKAKANKPPTPNATKAAGVQASNKA